MSGASRFSWRRVGGGNVFRGSPLAGNIFGWAGGRSASAGSLYARGRGRRTRAGGISACASGASGSFEAQPHVLSGGRLLSRREQLWRCCRRLRLRLLRLRLLRLSGLLELRERALELDLPEPGFFFDQILGVAGEFGHAVE